jgi:uncharacterized membrane protein HdeD (DUF308 family)
MSAADEYTRLADTGGTTSEDAATAMVLLETLEEIQEHWKWILTMGVYNVAVGMLCLLFPIFATKVGYLSLALIVVVSGMVSVTAVCFHPQGFRHSLFWVGLFQIFLGVFLSLHPFLTLTIMTLFIAVMFWVLGSLQIAVARQNPQMAARGLIMVSGLMAIVMSVLILLAMPMAQWYTIGVLLGVNLLNLGTSRILLALYGRSLALSDDRVDWKYYLETDRL